MKNTIRDKKKDSRRLLVYEPRVEGHHPGWLRFITEDLLSAGYELVLAVDLRKGSRKVIEEHLGDLSKQVELISAVDENGRPRQGDTAASIAACLNESKAPHAFLCAFDELASKAFRRTALGFPLSPILRGRIGGIYHRPRFTDAPWWSPNRFLKTIGFKKFVSKNWVKPLLFTDEYLTKEFKTAFPGKPFFFLPDPCPDDFTGDPQQARSALGLPADSLIFLFFGVGAKRKGLHLAVEAMLRFKKKEAFLLVAGKQDPSPKVRRELDELESQDRALLLNRFVTHAEEKLCFQAADVVLLPYLNHFGTSGILSRAMATGKPVIASDEQLLGHLVRDNEIGWKFPSGSVTGLTECLDQASKIDRAMMKRFKTNAAGYVDRYSRKNYRKALLDALTAANT